MKKVIISSKNPVKINSVRQAFEEMFPNDSFDFIGISVPSDVSDQPFSDEETLQGANNRVKNARKEIVDADYWVGLEGGLQRVGDEIEVLAWVVISTSTKSSRSRTGTFLLPKKIVTLLNEGKDLGEADDIVFSRTNSKQGNGSVGILTGDVIDRTKYMKEAVVLALIPFRNKELYL